MARRAAKHGRRTSPTTPRTCRGEGCSATVILARGHRHWIALEAQDRHGLEQAGCLVLVDQTAWRLTDLIEHFMARFEVPEPKARDLALSYPFHRPHRHEPATTSTTDTEQETHRS